MKQGCRRLTEFESVCNSLGHACCDTHDCIGNLDYYQYFSTLANCGTHVGIIRSVVLSWSRNDKKLLMEEQACRTIGHFTIS